MVRVEFLGPMNHIPPREFEVSDLRELKTQLADDEALRQWLAISAVAVNDVVVDDIGYPLKHGDKVVLLPPVCGG